MSAEDMDPQCTNAPSNNHISIREYHDGNSADQAALMSLVRELQAHEVVLYDRMKPPQDLKDAEYLAYLRENCHEDSGVILFAEETTTGNAATAIVGYAVVLCKVASDRIEEVEHTYGEIAELAVTERARGRGIGRQLLQACEQRVLVEADVSYLRTEVLASNAGARKAYSKFGFQDHLISMEKKIGT